MEIILIRPTSKEQIRVFEEMAKILKIPFELKEDSPYNPEFVAMVKKADKDFESGKSKKIKLDDIWK